jgi:hypothetical protein
MKKYLIACLLLCPFLSTGQKSNAEKISTKVLTADIFIETDKFGYHYGIKDNALFKFKDDTLLEYKNLSLGRIKKVDLHNPLKIILFYEDFNTIVTLDNQLNETQKINFSDNPVPIAASATGMASQNRFWIYNSLTQQIGLYDYLKNTYIPLTQQLQGNIRYYDTDFNYFQWIDDKLNWYVCDIFGKITIQGKIADFDKIQIIDTQRILFSKDGNLFLTDLKNQKTYTIENVEKSFKSFSYKEQILSIFTTEGITNYKITIP